MPPKARITKGMIIDAAFEIAKTNGQRAWNAAYHGSGTRTQSIISSAVLCVLSVVYALWIWTKAEHKKEKANER